MSIIQLKIDLAKYTKELDSLKKESTKLEDEWFKNMSRETNNKLNLVEDNILAIYKKILDIETALLQYQRDHLDILL